MYPAHTVSLLWLTTLGFVAACTPPAMPLSLASSSVDDVDEVAALERPASGMSCGGGEGVALLGKVSCALDAPRSWSTAEAGCGEHGGRLAQLVSEVDEVLLRAALASPVPASALWIDLRRSDGGWRWGDAAVTHTAWRAGEPNDAGGREDCGEWSTRDGAWNDVPCDAMRAVLCEVPTADACAAEAVETPHGRYCVYSRARLSHGQAQVLCERTGGKLARLETAAEGQSLRSTVGSLIAAERVWVGLSNRGHGSQWRWAGAFAATHGWLRGEPNNAGGNERCGEWWPETGGFNDLPCDRKLTALCELSVRH